MEMYRKKGNHFNKNTQPRKDENCGIRDLKTVSQSHMVKKTEV